MEVVQTVAESQDCQHNKQHITLTRITKDRIHRVRDNRSLESVFKPSPATATSWCSLPLSFTVSFLLLLVSSLTFDHAKVGMEMNDVRIALFLITSVLKVP